MGSIRKYIRLYENKDEDMKILEELSKYQEYGFRSEGQMIMEALRRYLSNDISSVTAEELADLIAERLSGKIILSSDTAAIPSEDPAPDDNDVYDAALSFLDTL